MAFQPKTLIWLIYLGFVSTLQGWGLLKMSVSSYSTTKPVTKLCFMVLPKPSPISTKFPCHLTNIKPHSWQQNSGYPKGEKIPCLCAIEWDISCEGKRHMKFFDDGKGGFTQGFGMGGTRSFHLMTIFTILSGTHTSCDSYIALSLCFMWFVSEDFDIGGQRHTVVCLRKSSGLLRSI